MRDREHLCLKNYSYIYIYLLFFACRIIQMIQGVKKTKGDDREREREQERNGEKEREGERLEEKRVREREVEREREKGLKDAERILKPE